MGQPHPIENDGPRIAEVVIDDIRARMRRGVREYGCALQARNGRRALQDLYEELLDGAHYVRQRLEEEDRALVEATSDAGTRQTLSDIYDRADVVRRNRGQINKHALEERYIGDIGRLRVIVEALLTELVSARATPPPPPEGCEVALYQYGCVGKGEPLDAGDDYDQDWVDRWVDDPGSLVTGYYPVYRPLYGGRWYRVDPEEPPVQPERSEYGPEAPDPVGDDGEAPEGLPGEGAE